MLSPPSPPNFLVCCPQLLLTLQVLEAGTRVNNGRETRTVIKKCTVHGVRLWN